MIREQLLFGRKSWRLFLADLPPFADRVLAGTVWLDRQVPGWHRKIHEPIDVGSLDRGPLEQVFDIAHANQARPLGIRDELRLGFTLPAENTSNAAYFAAAAELSREWTRVVSGRIGGGVFSTFTKRAR